MIASVNCFSVIAFLPLSKSSIETTRTQVTPQVPASPQLLPPEAFRFSLTFSPFPCIMYLYTFQGAFAPRMCLCLLCNDFKDRLDTHCDQCQLCQDAEHRVQKLVEFFQLFDRLFSPLLTFLLPCVTITISSASGGQVTASL